MSSNLSTSKATLNRTTKNKVKWNIHDSKVNLAALLNDPRKARRDYDLFTKTWGETFRDLPPDSTLRRSKWIPNVQKGHFSDYLANTSDQLLRHDSQSPQSLRRVNAEDGDLNDKDDNKGFVSNSKAVIKSAIAAQQERDAIMKTRLALDALPKLFLRTDFNMGNPHIFESVLSVNERVSDVSRTKENTAHREISSSKLLQERLNHFLDRVEMAIVRQISLQSEAFFKAMASHDELHEYLNTTMTSTQDLIKKFKQIKGNIVSNSLQVVHLRRSYINCAGLIEKLHMMVTVHQTQPTIQLLLSTSEYAGSLDLIRTTQDVLHQELAGLHCFRHLSSQLAEMERVIGQMMRQEMDECLRAEIHRSLENGHMCVDPHKLTAVTLGLLRQGQFDFLPDFRNEIEMAVKTIIKETVSGCVGSSGEENETLASRMRSLSFSEWLLLLDTLFDNLLILLQRIKALLDLLTGVARESVARGDVCRISHKKKFNKSYLSKRKPLPVKKNKKIAAEQTQTLPKVEDSNPFADSTSNSDYDEKMNPFEDSPTETSDPLYRSRESPKKVPSNVKINGETDENNPFLDDLDEDNDFNDIGLMDGLASYEDELINTAADSFVSPIHESKCSKNDRISSGLDSAEYSSEQSDSENQTIAISTDEVLTSDEFDIIAASLKELLVWTCNFQQDRCVKVLIAKGKDNSLDKLNSSDFLRLAKSIERYTSDAEAIVRKHNSNDAIVADQSTSVSGASSSLRSALQTQASRFVARFHDERRNKLSLILDNENWKQAEVPLELSTLLQSMAEGNVSLNHYDDQNKTTKSTRSKKTNEFLVLDGSEYAVVGTVLILLKMVSEYCKCSDDLPTSTPDLVNRLRDLLTLFNSRTCQLVLGAGALQLVGLKTITTKHLALASRCLQLVLCCLPSIKRHFELKLDQIGQSGEDKSMKHRGILRHFDHVTKDYQDHVNEVENKLTVIVAGVVDRHLSKWEVKAPVPSPAFRNMCKQIVKFHDTVGSLLPQDQITRILLKLNTNMKERLRTLLRRFEVRNNGGPQHGLVTSDLSFYESNIKNLKGMKGVDLALNSVWS